MSAVRLIILASALRAALLPAQNASQRTAWRRALVWMGCIGPRQGLMQDRHGGVLRDAAQDEPLAGLRGAARDRPLACRLRLVLAAAGVPWPAAGKTDAGLSPRPLSEAQDAPELRAALLPARRCLLRYEGSSGCALNVRVPDGWQRLESSYGLRFQLRALRFLLPPPREAAGSAVLEIRYAPMGLPPPRIRGWRGVASSQMVEAQLQDWEEEFPPLKRTSPARRSGAFDLEAATAVSLAVGGLWTGRRSAAADQVADAADTAEERASRPARPDYALLGAIVPSRPASEGERQYAFVLRAVGPAETLSAAAGPFAAFVRSARTDDTFAF